MIKSKIIPHISLMEKIGAKNYRLSEAIAELIDNSIDAGATKIKISLQKNKIIIKDDGNGMNQRELINALTMAYSEKKNQLGYFGLGMKSACSNLGKAFEIGTCDGKGKSYHVNINLDELKDWEIDIDEENSFSDKPYTEIIISMLRKKLDYPVRAATLLLADFGERYGPLLEKIEININDRLALPIPIDVDESTKLDIEFCVDNDTKKRVTGWIGIRIDSISKKSKVSQKGNFGFMTYRNGRLITRWDKLEIDNEIYGIYPHGPTCGWCVGELDLDFLAVENDKRGFIKETEDYEKVVKTIFSDYFTKIKKLHSSQFKDAKASHTVLENTKLITDSINETLKTNTLIHEIIEEQNDGINPLIIQKKGKRKRVDNIKGELIEIGVRDVINRDKDNVGAKPSNLGTEHKKYQRSQMKRRSFEITIGQKVIKVIHMYKEDLSEDQIRDYSIEKDGTLIVMTNVKAVPKITGEELHVYALHNICESLSEVALKDKSHFQIERLKEKILIHSGRKIMENLSKKIFEDY